MDGRSSPRSFRAVGVAIRGVAHRWRDICGVVSRGIVTSFALIGWCLASEAASSTVSSTPSTLRGFQGRLSPGVLNGSNLLFITWDTVRADHIGCYGYAAARTPTLDGLATRGVRFVHAFTGVPSTLPSHCTMFTGLEVPRHGVRTNGKFSLQQERVTLAEVLKQRGYSTAAFVATYVLNARFGLNRGFDHYDDTIPDGGRRAGNVTDAAVAWLGDHLAADAKRPFFMWVHYFDAHRQDLPPAPFSKQFPDRPYDGHIAYIDSQMRRLLEFVEAKGRTARTLIIVTADHGEGLGDHLEPTHSRLIYDSTMRIPFVMSFPRFHDAPCRVKDVTVGTIDFMPTVLSLLGIDAGIEMDGVDLVTATVTRDRVLYLETLAPLLYQGWAPLHGVRRIDVKYIAAPLPEYYNVAEDPGELHNLLETDPHAADGLVAELGRFMAGWPSDSESAEKAQKLASEAIRRLASLGYVSVPSDDPTAVPERPDPKDMVPIWRELRRSDPVELGRLARELLKTTGDKGACRRAVILAGAACRAKPDDPELLRLLCKAQYRAGRLEDAAETMAGLKRVLKAAGDENDRALLEKIHKGLDGVR